MANRRTFVNAILLAVFAVVCIGAMEFLAVNIGQPNPLSHGYRVRALFGDADGIPTAADVRVSGVVVGKVVDVAHDPNHPGYTVATLDITDATADPVYRNGAAKVRPKTLLGEKYVDLTLGDQRSEPIASGGTMDPSQGSKAVENDEIFNAFDARTRSQQQVVLKDLDAALGGRSGDIQHLLPQLDAVVQDLAPVARVYERDNPLVDQILSNVDTLMRTLADEHVQIGEMLRNGSVAIGAIADRDTSLVTTLTEATRVQDALARVLNPTVAAQQQAITRMGPTLDSLHRFIDQVIDPQARCGGRPCGLAEVLTGTLLGKINYPDDQLTVTGPTPPGCTPAPSPCSLEGEYVAAEYDSMFSNPANGYRTCGFSGQPTCAVHSALNIVLSEQCDSIQSTLQPVLGIDPTGTLGQAVLRSCRSAVGSGSSNRTSGYATDGGATDSLLASLEGMLR